jgi:hypothetical protein
MSDERLSLDVHPRTATVAGGGAMPGLRNRVAHRLADDGFEVIVSGASEDAPNSAEEAAEAGRRTNGLAGSVRRTGGAPEPPGRTGPADAVVVSVTAPPGTRPGMHSPDDGDAEADAAPVDDQGLPRPPVDFAREPADGGQRIVVYVVPLPGEDGEADRGGEEDRAAFVATVESMTHDRATELAPMGVRVNTVVAKAGPYPGTTGQPTRRTADAGSRAGHGRDLVDMVCFLASPAARPVNGTTLSV